MFRIDDAKCIKDSGKAILVEAPCFDNPEWIPQSVVHDNSDVYSEGDKGVLIVQEWFAEKKGWS